MNFFQNLVYLKNVKKGTHQLLTGFKVTQEDFETTMTGDRDLDHRGSRSRPGKTWRRRPVLTNTILLCLPSCSIYAVKLSTVNSAHLQSRYSVSACLILTIPQLEKFSGHVISRSLGATSEVNAPCMLKTYASSQVDSSKLYLSQVFWFPAMKSEFYL